MSNYTPRPRRPNSLRRLAFAFAYRRFANRRFGATIDISLLFFMHFTGLTGGFAQDRGVILFNNTGVSNSLAVKFRLRLKSFRQGDSAGQGRPPRMREVRG